MIRTSVASGTRPAAGVAEPAPARGFGHAVPERPRHHLHDLFVQPQLEMTTPGDPFEQEAESVAARILDPGGGPVTVARRVDASVARQVSANDEEDEAEDFPLTATDIQSKAAPGGTNPLTGAIADRVGSLRGGGEPLAARDRAFFESRMGHSFGDVRVHRGAVAQSSARDLNARAYTVGSDIAFARGEYRPETHGGRQLLAHELTHVVQQSGRVARLMRACDCAAIGGRAPSAKEHAFYSPLLPRLVKGDYCITAGSTNTYNCIAWSVGNTSKWIDTATGEVDSVYGDKDGTVSLSDFDAFYKAHGMTPAVGWTPLNPKVALYAKGTVPQHAALKRASGCGYAFESKLGPAQRIVHDGYQLEGGAYGTINRYYI